MALCSDCGADRPTPTAPVRVALTESARHQRTYPEYFAVLVVAVLPGVVFPWYSELVLAHVAQARVLARLHLSYEPAGKLRLGRAGEREARRSHKDFGQMKHLKSTNKTFETGRHQKGYIYIYYTDSRGHRKSPNTQLCTPHRTAELVPHGEIIDALQLPYE